MSKEHILGDREKAMEDGYFRDQDAKLLKMLRERAQLDEIALMLGEKLRVDDPALLAKVRSLGITLQTAPAFFLAPLVQIAWAEGRVLKDERGMVLILARQRGIAPDTPAYELLEEWLKVRPSDDLFDTAVEVLRVGFTVLPPEEREERIKDVVRACRDVAEASGALGRLLGLGNGISQIEEAMLDRLARMLGSAD